MDEIQLAALIKSSLDAGLTSQGITAAVKRNYQPRQQGAPSTPVILFYHVSSILVGWPAKQDVWNSTTSDFDHIETQNRESTWQISALAPQTPLSATAMTTADYVLAASMVIQSDPAVKLMAQSEVGLRHVTDVRSMWFADEKGQFEESPSFDIVLSYQAILKTSTPKIDKFSLIIEGV